MDSGSLYSNMGPGMLGLEMSLHHQIPQQNPHHHHMQQPPPHPQSQPPPHHPIVSYAHQETADNQQVVRQGFPFGNNNKGKNQSLNFSDDDEPGPGVSADNNSTDDGKRNGNRNCPWQRMKWTDNMVKLLIMVVYYIGDEVGSEGNNNNNDPSGKKKSGGGGGGVGVLQKKGKWKSVSRAMMERGFYVSPQQCEDKFNDLNKRYKRVNDILGKGTACRVVENQNLLESMDHLSPKMKEEAKKLLNSKHLFFREMCAYHNSCGHNNTGNAASGSGVANSQAHQNQLEQQQKCLHSSENANANANARIGASLVEGPKMPKGASGENDEDDDDEDEDEDEEDDDDEVSGARGHDHDHDHHHEDDDDMDERSRKRQRKLGTSSPMVQQLSAELANVVQDRGRSPLEKRQWMKTRMMQLEEQHVSYQCQAFELQKQRLKWAKFISKKEREMEREKLINDRKNLENERMVLLLKQKELELLDYAQHHLNNNRNSDPSSVTG